MRSYAAIFFLLLAVISVQVEHLPSLAVFSENLFGSTARSFLADRSLCEVFAHWRRIVAAFVSFCAQYCCCMPVKSVTTHLRGDLLPAACDFRSVIAYFIL
jgi:hypothetical protein